MALFQPQEWTFAEQAADLVTTNPFQTLFMEKQRRILGDACQDDDVYSWQPGLGLWGPKSIYPDVDEMGQRIHELSVRLHQRLLKRPSASESELDRYQTLTMYRLYRKYAEPLDLIIDAVVRGARAPKNSRDESPDDDKRLVPNIKLVWREFRDEHKDLLQLPGYRFPLTLPPEHVFACFFLFRRAFYHIFFNIVGRSKPIVRLRGAVWESIVTHDLRSWTQGLHNRMRDFPTLITGPSGTGKELVAQAIGRSLYIPFNPKREAFEVDFLKAFYPVNLSALPPLLIEAELFGHVRGAFAGAIGDRIGRLEECPRDGAVFLDEIGELSAEIQVKLLRVLQSRTFQVVGSNEDKHFHGKIIAATNRNLADEMRQRRFREDFYYRLCADQITTPSLAEQLADRPDDLPIMVEFVCRSVVGEERALELAGKVVHWIDEHLQSYRWPGNFRELEQCVRSFTLRKEYQPVAAGPAERDAVADACEALAQAILDGPIPYKKVERLIFALVRRGTPTDIAAANLLGCNYRTLQSRLKQDGK